MASCGVPDHAPKRRRRPPIRGSPDASWANPELASHSMGPKEGPQAALASRSLAAAASKEAPYYFAHARCPVLEHGGDIDAVAKCERQVEIRPAVAAAGCEGADDRRTDDALVCRGQCEHALARAISVFDREHHCGSCHAGRGLVDSSGRTGAVVPPERLSDGRRWTTSTTSQATGGCIASTSTPPIRGAASGAA